jgi:UDP-N-acetylmuramoyl-L-alanyl-D-glutamate--2,6-diaminopimelate ligase
MNILQRIKQSQIPVFMKDGISFGLNTVHYLETFLLSLAYRWPIKRFVPIVITGTDGKTTTSYMIHSVLNKNGFRSGLMSTVAAHIGSTKIDTGAHVTTPSRTSIQKLLRKMLRGSCEYLVIEYTAHAIDQHRLVGLHPKILVYTNITPEHLDYFGTFDNYLKTKATLIKHAEKVLINSRDPSKDYLITVCKKHRKAFVLYDSAIMEGKLSSNWKKKFSGEYNKQNAAAAFYVGKQVGVKDAQIITALEEMDPPTGRYQILHKKPTIVVDFAHTPNALSALLGTIKEQAINGRIISVFGCAGERDKIKRPEMGKIASQLANVVILTSEDPRTEKAETICEEIESGCKLSGGQLNKSYYKIYDRTAAIEYALDIASSNDWIVISGKGHEKTMCFGTTETPWSDIEAVETIIAKKRNYHA